MNDILSETLRLVFSSARAMPAHFTQSGDRKQSFCIDFKPLKEADDYEMASESWYSSRNYITETLNLSDKQHATIIKCGEDIMVGSFIFTKLGGVDIVEKIKSQIIDNVTESSSDKDIKQIFSLKEVDNYLNHCVEFGKDRAQFDNQYVDVHKGFVYWTRWIAVLPGALLGGILASFPLHWVLYLTLRNKVIFIDPYPELPERILLPFVMSTIFIWAGSRIAPDYKPRTSVVLFGVWLFFTGGFIFLTLFGSEWFGYQLYFRGSGIGPVLSIIGAFVGLYVTRWEIRNLTQRKT